MTRSYHHPKPVGHNLASFAVWPFTSKDGTLFAVIDLSDGGSLWLSERDVARKLLAAAAEAVKILDLDVAGEDPATECHACHITGEKLHIVHVSHEGRRVRIYLCQDKDACGVRRAALHVAPPQADGQPAKAGA